jgi:hypothetical protein
MIDTPGQEGAICGRPAHDHWTISASSGQHTSHYLPVMIAPFLDQFIETASRKKFGRALVRIRDLVALA